MATLTVNKTEDSPPIYVLTWVKTNGKSNEIRLSEETYLALEDYFKPKKSKKKPSAAPSLQEVKDYFSSEGYQEDTAIRFFKFYDSMEWYDSNSKPILRWKSKAISTWFKPENKLKATTSNKTSFFDK